MRLAKLIPSAIAIAAATTGIADSQQVKLDGIRYVRSLGAISEYELESNGLQILLLEDQTAPVVTFMVTYRVGSRNEVTGTTGATHLLEHLMFKGTERFDRARGAGFDQVLERVGADTNATTWLDRTNYFATVPPNALSLLIEIEADRMRNLALREEDRKPEMVVVRNEFERGENDPMQALDKEIWSTAFLAHPYHHDTIGWRSDIEKVPIARLREFYDTFYWPDNATVTVIGNFQTVSALREIQKWYGKIPRAPRLIPEVYTEEPEQTGPRRVTVKRAGEIGLVAIAHKIPRATDAAWPSVQVLSSILTGGRTSRCYRSLTDQNLTSEVFAHTSFNRDPSLHITYAELTPGTKHEEVEKRLVAEIERIRERGVSNAEVRTAVTKLLSERAYAKDGTFAQAEQLNECIAVGDWTLHVSLDDAFQRVTADDVRRVAQRYFIADRSVTGWFVPTTAATSAATGTAAEAGPGDAPPLKEVVPPQPLEHNLDAPPATNFGESVLRRNIAGMDLLLCRTSVKDVVTIRGSIAAGESASPNRALAHLTAAMLERGTKKRDKFAIAALLENAGVIIETRVGTDTVEFEARMLRAHVPVVVSILAEQLRIPAFSAAEFAKAKKQLVAELQQTLEDTDAQAAIGFSQAVFPKTHPHYRQSVTDLVAAIRKATISEVKAFHAENYGPEGMHVAVAGDIEPEDFHREVETAFKGWKGGRKPRAAEAPGAAPADIVVQLPDKSSVSVFIGQATGLRAGDPGWLELNVGTGILGRGFTSRLVGNVRDREGLTYRIAASLADDTCREAVWITRASFAPALLERGLASTQKEIEAWWRDGVTADELDYRKSAVSGQFAVAMETTHGLAEQLLRCAERGFEVSWLDEFPSKVRALNAALVNAAIRRHLDPAKMTVVKAGTIH